MEEIKAEARKSGLFMVTDSDLAFNNPVIRSRSTAPRPTISASPWPTIGETLAMLVGDNYVNRFNLEGRSYEVIPQVPRAERLTPTASAIITSRRAQRRASCRCRPSFRSRPAPTPTR